MIKNINFPNQDCRERARMSPPFTPSAPCQPHNTDEEGNKMYPDFQGVNKIVFIHMMIIYAVAMNSLCNNNS